MSRPTELQLRPPREISSAIYLPAHTYTGDKLAYKPKSPQKKPFVTGEERFLVTKVT